jgi:hypothetical protein
MLANKSADDHQQDARPGRDVRQLHPATTTRSRNVLPSSSTFILGVARTLSSVTRRDLRGSYVVFSQAEGVQVDIAAWDAHAQRFFRTRLSLAVAPPAAAREADESVLLVAPAGAQAGARHVHARQRQAADLALAETADVAGSGLALLARRCPTVWLVAREGEDDPLALRLAAILASVLLGPILDPRIPELLGVKSARARFEP